MIHLSVFHCLMAGGLACGLAISNLSAQIPHTAEVTSASGVNIHFTHAQAGELEMIREAGFKWIRMDLTWEATEREKGKYDFTAYEHLLKSLDAQGLKAWFILDYSNKLYEPLRSVTTDEGRAAYARWAAATVKHFAGRGVIWEIWNEPNIEGFWKPKPKVEDYVKMARAACQAIREAAPGECVVGPGSSTIDLEFLEGCFKGGLLEWWQGVSVHPYRQTGPESVAAEYHQLRKLISRYAPEGKKVAVLSGEWGYSGAWQNFNAALQGRMLARQWVVNAASGIPVSIWYDWKDDGPDPKEAEHRFGTVEREHHAGQDPAYTPKPAYLAAQTFNRELAGFRFVKRVNLGDLDHHGYLFEREGAQCLVAWTTGGVTVKVPVPVSGGRFSLVGHLGQVGEQPVVEGGVGDLELTLTDAPVYVRFHEINNALAGAVEALPLRLSVLPCGGGNAAVQVTSCTDSAVTAKATLTGLEGVRPKAATAEVHLKAGEGAATVLFPLSGVPAADYRVGASLEVAGLRVLQVPARRFVMQPAVLEEGLRTFVTGDDKVPGKAELTRESAPVPLPTGGGECWRLRCQFGAGWKFVQVIGAEGSRHGVKGLADNGLLKGVHHFGMWVHGDNSGTVLRLRLQDASGVTWQPDGPTVNWKGWRFVEFRLDERTAHWGGAGTPIEGGIVHPTAPLNWDSVLLLDNPARAACDAEIWFQPPLYIEETR